jgi:hypothetical protein
LSFARVGWIAPLVLLFAAVSIPYALKVSEHGSAFVRWRNQLHELFSSEDIYLRHAYPNPPIMGLILYPLAVLPPLIGALTWYFAKAALTMLTLSWTFRLVAEPGRSLPLGAKWLIVLLAIRPILGDLTHGNVNLFILFLLTASLYAFQRGFDLGAGVGLGLAIACKVTPALFVPYFLWKRSGRVLAGCALGLVLFLGVVPTVLLGWQRNVQLLESWTAQMVRPYVNDGAVLYTAHKNQSLPAVLLRLTTASPSFTTYVDDELTPVAFHNLVELDPAQAKWLIRGCMIAFGGLLLWSGRTPTGQRHGWRMPAEFGLVMVGMLLFSERTWKHHGVVLLLPLAVLVYYFVCGRPGWRMRCYLAGTLAGAWGLMGLASLGDWGELAEVYGVYVAAHLVLAAALVVLLRFEAKHRGEQQLPR